MTVREQELKAHRFKIDEKQRKLRDLNELKQHINATLDRLSAIESAGTGSGAAPDRSATLRRSLDEIDRQVEQTRTELLASQQILDEQENVRDGYDRVPVAVGSRRGRGQVEHIRIVRTNRN